MLKFCLLISLCSLVNFMQGCPGGLKLDLGGYQRWLLERKKLHDELRKNAPQFETNSDIAKRDAEIKDIADKLKAIAQLATVYPEINTFEILSEELKKLMDSPEASEDSIGPAKQKLQDSYNRVKGQYQEIMKEYELQRDFEQNKISIFYLIDADIELFIEYADKLKEKYNNVRQKIPENEKYPLILEGFNEIYFLKANFNAEIANAAKSQESLGKTIETMTLSRYKAWIKERNKIEKDYKKILDELKGLESDYMKMLEDPNL